MEADEVQFILEDPDMVKDIVTKHLVGVRTIDSSYVHNGKMVTDYQCGRCHRFVYFEYQYCTSCGGLIQW